MKSGRSDRYGAGRWLGGRHVSSRTKPSSFRSRGSVTRDRRTYILGTITLPSIVPSGPNGTPVPPYSRDGPSISYLKRVKSSRRISTFITETMVNRPAKSKVKIHLIFVGYRRSGSSGDIHEASISWVCPAATIL